MAAKTVIPTCKTKRNKRRNGYRRPYEPQPTGKPKTPVSGGGR
jgi:hypothetical protein